MIPEKRTGAKSYEASKSVKILISAISDVKDFVAISTRHDVEATLSNDRYDVDAKSIMGVFSLDLSTPNNLFITAKSSELIDAYINDIKNYIVD